MGCLIAFRCRPDSQTGDPSFDPDDEMEPDSEYRTNPDACISSEAGKSTPFDTILSDATIPLVEINCNFKEKTDDPPITSEQMVGTSGKGGAPPGKGNCRRARTKHCI